MFWIRLSDLSLDELKLLKPSRLPNKYSLIDYDVLITFS